MAAIRAKIYSAIATAYPHLADECNRQRLEREDQAAFQQTYANTAAGE